MNFGDILLRCLRGFDEGLSIDEIWKDLKNCGVSFEIRECIADSFNEANCLITSKEEQIELNVKFGDEKWTYDEWASKWVYEI